MASVDDSGLRYNISIGSFISTRDDENSGHVVASLGQFSNTSVQFSQETNTWETLTSTIANREVWPDKPFVNVVIQARDESFSTHVRLEVNVTLSGSSGMQA